MWCYRELSRSTLLLYNILSSFTWCITKLSVNLVLLCKRCLRILQWIAKMLAVSLHQCLFVNYFWRKNKENSLQNFHAHLCFRTVGYVKIRCFFLVLFSTFLLGCAGSDKHGCNSCIWTVFWTSSVSFLFVIQGHLNTFWLFAFVFQKILTCFDICGIWKLFCF